VATKKVDYRQDLEDFTRTGTNKISGRLKTVEDLKKLKHAPEAVAKLAAFMVGEPFADAASGVVNTYNEAMEGKNKKSPMYKGGKNTYNPETLLPRKPSQSQEIPRISDEMKHGGSVKKYASGGYVKSADGIAQRGKTKGRKC